MATIKALGKVLGQQYNYRVVHKGLLTNRDVNKVFRLFMGLGPVITFEQHRSLIGSKILSNGRVIFKIKDDGISLKEHYKIDDDLQVQILDNSRRREIRPSLLDLPEHFQFFNKDTEMKDYIFNLVRFDSPKKQE